MKFTALFVGIFFASLAAQAQQAAHYSCTVMSLSQDKVETIPLENVSADGSFIVKDLAHGWIVMADFSGVKPSARGFINLMDVKNGTSSLSDFTVGDPILTFTLYRPIKETVTIDCRLIN